MGIGESIGAISWPLIWLTDCNHLIYNADYSQKHHYLSGHDVNDQKSVAPRTTSEMDSRKSLVLLALAGLFVNATSSGDLAILPQYIWQHMVVNICSKSYFV